MTEEKTVTLSNSENILTSLQAIRKPAASAYRALSAAKKILDPQNHLKPVANDILIEYDQNYKVLLERDLAHNEMVKDSKNTPPCEATQTVHTEFGEMYKDQMEVTEKLLKDAATAIENRDLETLYKIKKQLTVSNKSFHGKSVSKLSELPKKNASVAFNDYAKAVKDRYAEEEPTCTKPCPLSQSILQKLQK